MSKFAVGQQVEDAADDLELGAVVPVNPAYRDRIEQFSPIRLRGNNKTATVENPDVQPSGKARLPTTKRRRSPSTRKRAKANAGQTAPVTPTTDSVAPAVAVPTATLSAGPVQPIAPSRGRASGAVALLSAVALAIVAAYFSVRGMAEIFPGAPVAVMVLAATMEGGKLVIAGWLAAHWRTVGRQMRSVLAALVAGLALINACGVFGKLVEAHISVGASARSTVAERIEALDARITAQS